MNEIPLIYVMIEACYWGDIPGSMWAVNMRSSLSQGGYMMDGLGGDIFGYRLAAHFHVGPEVADDGDE